MQLARPRRPQRPWTHQTEQHRARADAARSDSEELRQLADGGAQRGGDSARGCVTGSKISSPPLESVISGVGALAGASAPALATSLRSAPAVAVVGVVVVLAFLEAGAEEEASDLSPHLLRFLPVAAGLAAEDSLDTELDRLLVARGIRGGGGT